MNGALFISDILDPAKNLISLLFEPIIPAVILLPLSFANIFPVKTNPPVIVVEPSLIALSIHSGKFPQFISLPTLLTKSLIEFDLPLSWIVKLVASIAPLTETFPFSSILKLPDFTWNLPPLSILILPPLFTVKAW